LKAPPLGTTFCKALLAGEERPNADEALTQSAAARIDLVIFMVLQKYRGYEIWLSVRYRGARLGSDAM